MADERRRPPRFPDAPCGTCKWCGEPIVNGRVRQRCWHDGREPDAKWATMVAERGNRPDEVALLVAEPNCIREFNAGASQAGARAACEARDKGVCASCGDDVTAAWTAWNRARSQAYEDTHAERTTGLPYEESRVVWDRQRAAYMAWMREHPAPQWFADHVVPIWDGGELELHNLQTLCKGCHDDKTAREAAERAARRRPTPQGEQLGLAS